MGNKLKNNNTGKRNLVISLLILITLTSCGPFGQRIGNYFRVKVRAWFRYEIGNARSFNAGSSQIKPGYHIIGYDPSWLVYDSTYQTYPFELMTDYVIGEYDINSRDGLARFDSSSTSYVNKEVIEYINERNPGLNMMMALTHFGEGGDSYRRFLRNDVAKKNLINNLDAILEEFREKKENRNRDHVGIMLDFPNIPKQLGPDYAGLVSRLRSDLTDEEEEKDLKIYMVLPFEDSLGTFSSPAVSKQLRKNVDLFILRSHTFYNLRDSATVGPIVPMSPGDGYWLDSAVQYYTDVVEIPKKKMVVEVPYYGRNWVTEDSLSDSRPLIPLNEMLNTVMTSIQLNEKENLSIDHDTNFYAAQFRMGDTAIYAFEDTVTLDLKYEWILKNGVKGVSIYGLGYGQGIDNNVDEKLWDLIFYRFAESPPRLFFPGIAFFLMFFIVGIVWSVIAHWEVRYALREERGKLIFYGVAILVIIICMILCFIDLRKIPMQVKFIALALLIMLPVVRKTVSSMKKGGK